MEAFFLSLTSIPAIVGKDHVTDQMRLILSMPANRYKALRFD